ncbi:MAG: glycosyltransferase family 1 protein [Clostridiales bacterium]|nr:MAG: glycosyltransferase family 1 protein [Clostridiales bacterium]
MSEIRVLHLISGGDTGGARTHVMNLINGLSGKVFVLLVTLMESDFTEDAKKLKLPLTVLNQKSRFDFSVTGSIGDLIVENKINLIHVHGARANFISTFVKRKFPDIPIVTTVHSDYLLDDYRGGKAASCVFRKINANSLKKMDYYIGVSNSFKEMLLSRKVGKDENVFSVYNGLDFEEKTDIARDKEEFLDDYGIEKGEELIYAGIMGRLDTVKNHKLFVEVASEVLKTHKNYRFLLAGDGVLKGQLEKLAEAYGISDKVHFLGFVEKPYEFYNAIDINLLTSLSESFPYAMLEGARMKKPIVTSNVGGVELVVENGRTGYIVESFEAGEFARRVIMLGDESLREKMGKAIFETVKENFSMKQFVENHIEIYHKILEER